MSIEAFKEALVTPLKKTIEQHKSLNLAQFRSRDDLTKQWDRAEGMEMALNHIEATHASMNASKAQMEGAHNIEIIPPQN